MQHVNANQSRVNQAQAAFSSTAVRTAVYTCISDFYMVSLRVLVLCKEE